MVTGFDHRTDLLIDIDHTVDDIPFTAGQRFFNGIAKVFLVVDTASMETVGFRELHEIRPAVKRGLGITLAVQQVLSLAHHAERAVIENEGNYRKFIKLFG